MDFKVNMKVELSGPRPCMASHPFFCVAALQTSCAAAEVQVIQCCTTITAIHVRDILSLQTTSRRWSSANFSARKQH